MCIRDSLEPGTGKGQCRPGGDYGICVTADAESKALFSLTVKAKCGPSAICRLAYTYPDLGLVLNVPTQSPTAQPTLRPVAPTPPTASPTTWRFTCADAFKGGVSVRKAKAVCVQYPQWCAWSNNKCVDRTGAKTGR